jgi:hypothetical protein
MKYKLIDRCKDIKIQYENGMTMAYAMPIDYVRVRPESLFAPPESLNCSSSSSLDINIRISSIN